MTLCRDENSTWQRYVVDAEALHIEAGSAVSDIDGDGKGNFKDYIIHTGYGLHQSTMVDLDGDSDFDILGKPCNWQILRLDIWLQN